MSSTYSNLKLQLMATGENLATWGNVTNVNLGTAVEEAIVGSADVTFASGNVTLTLSNVNTTQTARNLRLNLIGATGGSTRNLVVPSIEKVYIINNTCADSVVVKTAAGTGITVPAGKTMWVYNDGTNVVDATTHLSSLTLGTPLPLASGGVGSNTAAGARSTIGAAQAGTNTDITSLQPLNYAIETATVVASALTGTINVNTITQSVLYYTTSASANWIINLRGDGSTTLNSLLSTGQAVTVVVLGTIGATGYYNTQVQIDGTTSGVTTRWQGGTAPTVGNTSSIDVYTYTVIKTASATYTVLASLTKFA
jgi:hypothetical protein